MTIGRRALAGVAALTAGLAASPQSLNAEANDASVDDVRCAGQLTATEQTNQVLLGLVSDPLDVARSVEAREATGIAPVGDFVERVGAPGDPGWNELGDSFRTNPPAIFASDEEGGVVQRLRSFFGPIPSARRQAETMTTAAVADQFAIYGKELAGLGVTMAFAPVVDVGGGPAIGDRSYGDDPAVVIEYAGAVIDGYTTAGLTPVIKHFPGHGRASADSHDGPARTPPLDELRQLDLRPFEALIAAHGTDIGVMVGHLDVPGLTDGLPASLSRPAITGLLRDEMRFDGVVVSDALGMGAIRQVVSSEDATVMFLRAGGDLALVDWADIDSTRATVLAALESGRLEPLRLHHAVNRVLRSKGVLAQRCSAGWPMHLIATARGALAPPT